VKLPYEIPSVIYVGKKVGEWPLFFFPDLESAQRWAVHSDDLRDRVFWSVAVPHDTVVYKAEIIPTSYRSKQVYP
jgi:hypothetical protein